MVRSALLLAQLIPLFLGTPVLPFFPGRFRTTIPLHSITSLHLLFYDFITQNFCWQVVFFPDGWYAPGGMPPCRRGRFQWQKRLRFAPAGVGVPDDPQVTQTPRSRALVGRPALWPPRRGQDPSLQIYRKRGCNGKVTSRACPAPTAQQKTPLHHPKTAQGCCLSL